jgi:hypothetical protein
VSDGQVGALRHKRQRHDMGLTIHYELAATGDEANARKLVQQLRQAALDLPFQHVGEIVEFQGEQCDWKQRPDDDPYRCAPSVPVGETPRRHPPTGCPALEHHRL